MTPFTRVFFESDFSKCSGMSLKDFSLDYTDVWKSHVPYIRVPGFDKCDINRLLSTVIEYDEFATESTSQGMCLDWCREPTSQGWSELTVIPITRDVYLHDGTHISVADTQGPGLDTADLFIDFFQRHGVAISHLKIKKLESNGWIAPHRDLRRMPRPLMYFWMPMAEYSSGLKMWPVGEIECESGSLLLCNADNFVHSARNRDAIPRYVMIGYIEPESCSDDFLKSVDQCSRSLWCS